MNEEKILVYNQPFVASLVQELIFQEQLTIKNNLVMINITVSSLIITKHFYQLN